MAKIEQTSIVVAGDTYVMPDVIKGLIDSLQIFNDVLIDENDLLKAQNEEFARYCSVLEQRIDQLEKNNSAVKHGFVTASREVLRTPQLLQEAMTAQRKITAVIARSKRGASDTLVKQKALELYDKGDPSTGKPWTKKTVARDGIYQELLSYANNLPQRRVPSKAGLLKRLSEWRPNQPKMPSTS